MSDRSCQGLQLLNAFVMLETELWLGITGLVILGGNQPQLGSKSCKVEIDGGGVWKRHADQMTTTGVGNGIEDEPVSMAVEPERRLDRQVPEVLPDSSDTEPGDMPGKLTSVNSTSPLALPSPQEPFGQWTIITRDVSATDIGLISNYTHLGLMVDLCTPIHQQLHTCDMPF
ncbi:hypothetical protein EMCRGX_G011517 [Ephydatia muelleri]